MPRLCAAFLLVFGIAAAAVDAQTRPNFAGAWVEDESARTSTVAAPRSGEKSAQLPAGDTVVTQSSSDIVIERKVMSQLLRYAYHLDGTESVNRNGANTLTTRSTWDGARLVTQGTSFSVTSAGESSWDFKEVRWLDASGAMITETTYKDERGKTDVVRRLYRRKPAA